MKGPAQNTWNSRGYAGSHGSADEMLRAEENGGLNESGGSRAPSFFFRFTVMFVSMCVGMAVFPGCSTYVYFHASTLSDARPSSVSRPPPTRRTSRQSRAY